jgi:predicted ATP-grasp superfamily ATP-dependent carboligase
MVHNSMRILVICGFNQCGVAAVRSLARAGHHVEVAVTLADHRLRLQQWFVSRYARHRTIVPHPRENPGAFQEKILDLCRNRKYDVILPAGEESTLALSAIQAALRPHTATPLDTMARMSLVHDKFLLHRTLRNAGFTLPRLYEYNSIEQLGSMEFEFPVVVKARKNSGALSGTRYVTDRAGLLNTVREFEKRPAPHPAIRDFSRPLIQEYIPGTVHDADCLCRHGSLRAIMTIHRKVMYPGSGGVTVSAVTTLEPGLVTYAAQILDFLKWHGLCEVEVKQDARDGKYKLMEINPRLWGQLGMSIKAGIPFPAKACEMAVQGDTAPVFDYRVGLHYTILFPRAIMSLAEPVKPRWPRFRETLRVLKRNGCCELDFRDPLPHVFDLLNTVRIFFNQAREKEI